MQQQQQPQTRRQARELALQILFQVEFSQQVSYSEFLQLFEPTTSKEVISYAELLIDGVNSHRSEIDSTIQLASQHWKIDRMALVDRNILRIAIFEMQFAAEPIKPAIAINEAIDIARKYGTTDSSNFVNGILDSLQRKS